MSLVAASVTATLAACVTAWLAAPLGLGLLLAHPSDLSARARREAHEVVCTGPLPFSEEEMRQALLARWHLLGGVSVVRVRAEGGRTLVQVGAVEREVDLEGREGEEAARIVAVMALDLAQAESPLTVSRWPEASVSASRPHTVRMGVLLATPFDQDGLVAHLEPMLDAALDVVPGLGAFVSAGYRQASTADTSKSLELRELPLRAGVTLRRRWLELRAGAIAQPRFVEGPRSYREVSWGFAASVAGRLPLPARLALVLTAGVDVFRTRMVFAVNDDVRLTTPWLSPWVGAGIAWEAAL